MVFELNISEIQLLGKKTRAYMLSWKGQNTRMTDTEKLCGILREHSVDPKSGA